MKYTETRANFNITNLAAGNHTLMVVYDADTNFTSYSASFTISVAKIAPVMNITNDTIYYLDNATFTVETNVPGYYTLFINGEEISIKVDELSLAEKDLVKFVGREYVGHDVVAPNAFVKLTKAAAE